MNNFNSIKLLFTLCAFAFLCSCTTDIPEENMYTFTGQTVGKYLEDNSENFSEFLEVLERTKTLGLLKVYGSFTCFAPTNTAMASYYAKKEKTGLDDFSDAELRNIAYDHLINGYILTRALMKDGRLNQLTMSDRYVSISYSGNDIHINQSSLVLATAANKDDDGPIHNGVVHVISEVLDPTRLGMVEQISQDSKFSIFYDALIETRLNEQLLLDVDEDYDPSDYSDLIVEQNENWRWDVVPDTKMYGYTVFMESDETMNRNGIFNLEDLAAYAKRIYDVTFPEDAHVTDVTDRRNSLNRFVAYHLVEKELDVNKLIDAYDNYNVIKTVDMYEYIETMCPGTLIEIRKIRSSSTSAKTNPINYINATGRYVLLGDKVDVDAGNGIYHEVADMLVYDIDVLNDHSTKRLRFDVASFFPEMTNNAIRGRTLGTELPIKHYQFPRGYLSNAEASEQTTLGYVESTDRLMNYQGDELFMDVGSGKLYDFTLTTLPVPAGTYEVRFGYLTNGARGVCQFYLNGTPAGVPVNLNNSGTNVAIGWALVGSDTSDPYGYENDKMMRNLGYMKAPASIRASDKSALIGRTDPQTLRKILGIYTLETGNQKLTVKGLSGGQFMLDYVEFVPISVIESEDIY